MNLQLLSLLIAYAATGTGMLIGLLVMRADARAYFRWPVYSAMVMALGVFCWSMLRRHVLPPEWAVTRQSTLCYGAINLYAVLGLAIGLLLGRLTRKRGKPDTAATSTPE